jgi:DnaK suppressor protein
VELDPSRLGRLSRMDALQVQQMAIEGDRRRLGQLRLIEAALSRLARDEYGTCVGCGEDIDPRRLKVSPLATRCIACADDSVGN